MIAILGAGISGISASYHLSKSNTDSIIYEKRNSWGGLCDKFTIGEGFRFDHFIHLSFTSSEYVKKLFAASADYLSHNPESTNFYRGVWLKHPVQNNLYPLSPEEKVKIIMDFIQRAVSDKPKNYHDWLQTQFGTSFSETFPEVYTKKYWTVSAKDLTTDWLAGRFSLPPLEKVLVGAFQEQEENFYYADEMRYPQQGGYKSYLNGMASKVDIRLNKEVCLIDIKSKKLNFTDGSSEYYETLISSLPLPELVKYIKDAPENVVASSNKLLCTSGQLVSLGFNRPDIPKNIWFYMYDDDILPARAYSPSIKSPDNVPEGKSSLQFETYFSRKSPKKLTGGNLIEHVVKSGERMKLFDADDVEVSDYREVKYANVVFDHNRKENLTVVHNYLDKIGIKYIGRFGEWDYLWSDQSLLSGAQIATSFKTQ